MRFRFRLRVRSWFRDHVQLRVRFRLHFRLCDHFHSRDRLRALTVSFACP